MLYVFNKMDKAKNITDLQPLINRFNPHVLVCGIEPDGLEPLQAYLTQQFAK